MNTAIMVGDKFKCTKRHGGEIKTFVATVKDLVKVYNGAPVVEYELENGAKCVATLRDFAALYTERA